MYVKSSGSIVADSVSTYAFFIAGLCRKTKKCFLLLLRFLKRKNGINVNNNKKL